MRRYLDNNTRLADYIYKDMDPEEMIMTEKALADDPELSESHLMNIQVKDYLQAKIQLEEMRSDPQLEDAEKLADLAFDTDSIDKVVQKTIPGGRRKRMSMRRSIAIAASRSSTEVFVARILFVVLQGFLQVLETILRLSMSCQELPEMEVNIGQFVVIRIIF